MATGVFDILHPGHLYFLGEARKLGDELVVVVARDATVKRLKREPIVPEHLRLEMVRGLKPVDHAVLGNVDDYFRVVEEWRPDVLALGHDQHWDEKAVAAGLAARGLRPRIVRVPQLQHDLMATRRIIEKILSAYHGLPQGDGSMQRALDKGTSLGSPEFLGDPVQPPAVGEPATTSPKINRGKGAKRRSKKSTTTR